MLRVDIIGGGGSKGSSKESPSSSPGLLDEEYVKQAIFLYMNSDSAACILPARNQLDTEACFACVTVDILYAVMFKKYGKADKAAEQDLVDYLHLKYPHSGCFVEGKLKIGVYGIGNSFQSAVKYIEKYGILKEKDYRFLGCFRKRRFEERPTETERIYFHGHLIRTCSPTFVAKSLHQRPYSITVFATPSFYYWKPSDGLYTGPNDVERLYMHNASLLKQKCPFGRHSMLIVGYGKSAAGSIYFIVKNSYGNAWGCSGFIWMDEGAVDKEFGFYSLVLN